MTDLDLRQMACLAQHKRHLVWRDISEQCVGCGISCFAAPPIRLGGLVRVYGKGHSGPSQYRVHVLDETHYADLDATVLEAP